MHNWSVDEQYAKKFPKQYKLWWFEQRVSYGLDGEKLNKNELTLNAGNFSNSFYGQIDPE